MQTAFEEQVPARMDQAAFWRKYGEYLVLKVRHCKAQLGLMKNAPSAGSCLTVNAAPSRNRCETQAPGLLTCAAAALRLLLSQSDSRSLQPAVQASAGLFKNAASQAKRTCAGVSQEQGTSHRPERGKHAVQAPSSRGAKLSCMLSELTLCPRMQPASAQALAKSKARLKDLTRSTHYQAPSSRGAGINPYRPAQICA